MTTLTEEQIGALSDEELARIVKELKERRAKGDKVVVPERQHGTVTSAVQKGVGPHVMAQTGDLPGNFSMFEAWNNPADYMTKRARIEAGMRDLRKEGYVDNKHWKSWAEFIKDGVQNARSPEFRARHAESFKRMNRNSAFFKARGITSISGEGGSFLINPEIAPTVDWLFNDNDLAKRIHTVNTNHSWYRFIRAKDLDRNDGSRHGGVFSKWIDEGESGTESYPRHTYTELRAKKLAVFVFYTEEMINDSPIAIEQVIGDAVRAEIDFAINRAIVWGADGVEPLGFANSNATLSIAKEAGQAARTVKYENLLKMLAGLYRTSQSKAVWLHHQEVIPQIGQLQLGGYPVSVNIQNGGVSQSVTTNLLGRPAIESELCAPLGDSGDIWYIDPYMYKAISQSMIREDVSMHVEFLTDQQCMRFILRFDGRPLHDTTITPFKAPGSANTPSPQASFVNLQART